MILLLCAKNNIVSTRLSLALTMCIIFVNTFKKGNMSMS